MTAIPGRRRHVRKLVQAASLAFVVAQATACSHKTEEAPAATAPQRPVDVTTAKPATRDVSRLITLPADIRAWEEATIYAKVAGTLAAIPVDKGDRVKAGQLLAEISAEEMRDDAQAARSNQAAADASADANRSAQARDIAARERAGAITLKAEAELKAAQAGTQKAESLEAVAKAAVKQSEYAASQARAGVEEAQAQLHKSQAELLAAQSDFNLATVTAQRLKAIYSRNAELLAKQDLDAAEARQQAAHGHVLASESAVASAKAHLSSVQAQLEVTRSQAEQSAIQETAAAHQLEAARAAQQSAGAMLAASKQEQKMSESVVKETQAKLRSSIAQAGSQKSAAQKAAAFSAYTRLYAPFAGIITRRFVDRGAFIQSASSSLNAASIVIVSDTSKLRILANVPETEARKVKPGAKVFINYGPLPEDSIIAKVDRTSGALDPKSRTLLVEADVPNTQSILFPGSYAVVRVTMETHKGVISLPTAAVGSDKSGKFVYIVSNGVANRKPVDTGFNDGDYVEIKTGVGSGDVVVVTGRDAVSPGGRVNATEWTPPVKKQPAK